MYSIFLWKSFYSEDIIAKKWESIGRSIFSSNILTNSQRDELIHMGRLRKVLWKTEANLAKNLKVYGKKVYCRRKIIKKYVKVSKNKKSA